MYASIYVCIYVRIDERNSLFFVFVLSDQAWIVDLFTEKVSGRDVLELDASTFSFSCFILLFVTWAIHVYVCWGLTLLRRAPLSGD